MRAHGSSEPQGAATARAPYENPATVSAPLFRSLIDRLAEDRRWVILDLGAVRTQTLALLSGHRCRLDVADLTHSIDALVGQNDGDRLAAVTDALLAVREPEPVDIALCWDFLNYLDRDALAALMARIRSRCRAGAFVHALIVYSERLMQQRPGQFVAIDADRMLNLAKGKPERIAPRYSPEDLSGLMPGFKTERVRLLGNGMQEYLFKAA
jgi:hypothetical protein